MQFPTPNKPTRKRIDKSSRLTADTPTNTDKVVLGKVMYEKVDRVKKEGK